MKSICFAYILLIFGGLAGLHLLYLGRDRQAFAYWCTFGGYFGLAVLRDFYRLPEYIQEANSDEKYMAKLAYVMHSSKQPPFSTIRFVAKLLIGNSWSYLWIVAVPNEEQLGFSLQFLKYLGPMAAALGVWLIGNIGREKVEFKWCSFGAYLVLPLSIAKFEAINWCCLTSAVMTEFKGKQWRRTPILKISLIKRMLYLSFGWILFCSLWVSYIYFNAEIEYKDGGKIKMKDSIKNFLKSPMFIEFKENLFKLYKDAKEHGWTHAWTNLIELLDPLGELHSLKVMGLKKGATQEEITSRYKILSKEWHPDRHKTAEGKKFAQDKFIEIANAYEKLSSIKKRRNQKSKL